MEQSAEEKRPQTKSGIALKLKRCEKGKMPKPDHSPEKSHEPNIKERCASARKALANLSVNVTEDVSDHYDPTILDERILDAALDASAMGHMDRASALAACAFTKLTPDRMRAVLRYKEEEKARFD